MSVTLSQRMLVSSLNEYLRERLPDGVSVSWSGQRIDTTDLDQWIVVGVSNSGRVSQRKSALDQRRLNVSIKLFQKPGSNMAAHLILERDVLPVLNHAEVDIYDYASGGEPRVGQMRFLEVQPSDDTRRLNEQGYSDNRSQELNQLLRTNVKMMSLTCKAVVQAD